MSGARLPFRMAAAIAALALSACASQSQSTQQPLPTLKEIKSQRHTTDQPSSSSSRRNVTTLLIRRLDLPFNADLNAAWPLLSTDGLAADRLALWQANGLRAGIIDTEHWPDFQKKLPAVWASSFNRLTGDGQITALALTPPLDQPAIIELTTQPNQTRRVKLTDGKCQLLVRTLKYPNGSVQITLTPHHHVMRPSVVPRTPQQKALDGTVFEELKLGVSLNHHRKLVVGLNLPAASSVQTQSSQMTDAKEPSEQTEKTTDEVDAAPIWKPSDQSVQIPDQLGPLLLGAKRYGKPIQMLLIFTAEDASSL